MTAPEFGRIYEFVYKTVCNNRPGYAPDQVAVIDAAVRLYMYERDKYDERLREEKEIG